MLLFTSGAGAHHRLSTFAQGLRVKEGTEGGWGVDVGTIKQIITFADCADVLTAVPKNPGKSTAKEEKCAIRARHVAHLIQPKDLGILAPNAHTADMKKWLGEGKDVRNVFIKEAVKQKAGEGWHGKLVVLGAWSKGEKSAGE